MRNIYPDRITSVTTDEENANYPASNVQSDYVKEKWKATSADAVLVLTVSQGAGVAIFGTNATTIEVAVSDGRTAAWAPGAAWASGAVWADSSGTSVIKTYDLSASNVGALWADYTKKNYKHIVELIFTGVAGSTIEAGVVRAGDVNTYRDPKSGITEGLRDYSIIKELNSGAFYTKKRDIVRIFGFQILEERNPDFYNFLLDVIQQNGPGPLAWRIVHRSITDWEWVVYARANGMPKGRHSFPAHSLLDILLIEMV